MDLINWSLNAIDTIFSMRNLGSGEPDCPDGTFAAGYTMDVWERWRIVCLAALSVEDIEDIYLFSAGLVAAGPDGCLLGQIHFPCGYVVSLWCMCFCVAEVFFLFSHCTPQGA